MRSRISCRGIERPPYWLDGRIAPTFWRRTSGCTQDVAIQSPVLVINRDGLWIAPRVAEAVREIPGLRHPLERRVATLVSVIDAVLMAAILGILFLGAEWLEARGALAGYAGQYVGHAKLLLALVLGAPILATFMRRRRRLIAQE